MIPFLPIFVFAGLFLAFSGKTLFGASSEPDNEQADEAEDEDKVVAIELTEAELADEIAIYFKSKSNN
ncbi:hypothetical protein [Adonisia turfae]|uniref:Uncharacterized protein n=1 Tax=Adonisia turfae CCMR0081 TaxID=2292702 RepID=A0A6M0RWD0_9CYAN|nr:hypothetical protein [Adonisia turfae]NEZ60133.1 hypothetical protein [Adonisia turfae CCMR0081]